MKTSWIVGGVLVALLLWFVGSYNRLVGKFERVEGAWGQVQNVYQRREDLIPNLVATVQGAAKFEKETLQAVVDARSRVGSFTVDKSVLNNPEMFKKYEAAQGSLGQALSRLMVVIEKYPDLKATANFKSLQDQLEGTENRITVERRSFNETVIDYNTSVRQLPGALVARLGGFTPKPYFEASTTAQKAPVVKF